MTDTDQERLTAKQFHAHPGVEDWRVLYWGAYAHYVCDSLAHAVALVDAVADIAAELGHDPDLDVRPHGVTIKTFTYRNGGLTAIDAELAARVQVVARARGFVADPSQLLVMGVAVAQDTNADVRPFWAAILGYELVDDADAIDPQRRNPHVWVHELTPPRPGRGRTHIDISVPAEQGLPRVDAAVAAGGRIVSSSLEGWTIASPENHGIDIAIWPDTGEFEPDAWRDG